MLNSNPTRSTLGAHIFMITRLTGQILGLDTGLDESSQLLYLQQRGRIRRRRRPHRTGGRRWWTVRDRWPLCWAATHII